MKKKVISLFVTGMLAVSMIAGCGSDNTADTSTSADTTADASTDAAADTTAEEAPAQTEIKWTTQQRKQSLQTVHP